VSKHEQVYDALRERILDGVYGPGYRLVIDRIAAEFGVSALPVREAIRRLEAEGLVIFRANIGAQVSPADPGLFTESLSMQAVLEGYASGLASAHVTTEDVDHLAALTDRMQESAAGLDVLGFSNANHEFHSYLVERSGNAPLIELVADIGRRLDAIRRTVFTHIPRQVDSSIADHREIIRLLREGASADKVEAAARAHKMRTVAAFEAWQEQHPDGVASEPAPPARTGPAQKPRRKRVARAS
jgi:DNA-binding GntR family transcriptional regulator